MGPVGVRFQHHFGYADGTPYKSVGTTMYSWAHRGEALETQTLKALAASPFNKVRMLVFPQTAGVDKHPPALWPFEGTPPKRWDTTRFNPAFFRHLEQRVGQLRDLGIEADLILHHPYDDKREWGLDNMPREVDDRYARYLVARLAAYRNVWWSLANEFDFIRTKTDADWAAPGPVDPARSTPTATCAPSTTASACTTRPRTGSPTSACSTAWRPPTPTAPCCSARPGASRSCSTN